MEKLCYALVATLLVTMTGCGDVQNANESENEGQTSQALTGCELDCPNGPVFFCSQPCSVTATTLSCNGTITTCPPPVICGNGVREFGEACDDGNVRSFDRCSPDCLNACPSGKIWCDCIAPSGQDGHCVTVTQCNHECTL
jgi:cysteine-rich repeat protein